MESILQLDFRHLYHALHSLSIRTEDICISSHMHRARPMIKTLLTLFSAAFRLAQAILEIISHGEFHERFQLYHERALSVSLTR